MTRSGSAGTAGANYRIPPKVGRHRAPVEPQPQHCPQARHEREESDR